MSDKPQTLYEILISTLNNTNARFTEIGWEWWVENIEEAKQAIEKLITEAVITELTTLHRTDGEGLPKRDFDNVTDEAICKRIEELENGEMENTKRPAS